MKLVAPWRVVRHYLSSGNTLYVRPSPALEQRLRDAPAVRVVGVSV